MILGVEYQYLQKHRNISNMINFVTQYLAILAISFSILDFILISLIMYTSTLVI
jgi:hypothetical protein